MLNTRMLFKNVTVEGGQTHDLNKFGKLCTLPRLEPRTQKCALPRGTSAKTCRVTKRPRTRRFPKGWNNQLRTFLTLHSLQTFSALTLANISPKSNNYFNLPSFSLSSLHTKKNDRRQAGTILWNHCTNFDLASIFRYSVFNQETVHVRNGVSLC